jgi:hypothetical protein
MTEASPIHPACVKGKEGEAEVGVGVKGERLTANAQWSALEELAPTAPVLPEEDEQVAAHLKDELRFLQKQRASEVGLVPDSDLSSAFENIVSDASGGTTRLHGQYIEVLVSKSPSRVTNRRAGQLSESAPRRASSA